MSLTSEDILKEWHAAKLAPLWNSPNAHKPPPAPVPAYLWRWQEMRPLIERAFAETSPQAVQRRVLQMLSPAAQSLADEHTCGNVLAAYQCLLPGETARPHRHTMNALRFMLEGAGVVTLVDGKECSMEFGDLVLTPGMCWHEHRHDGDVPVVWLDVLDVPLHMYMGSVVFQPGPIEVQPITMPDAAFASANVVPAVTLGRSDHSPVFRYPYASVVNALQHAPKGEDGIRRVKYINPLNGQGAMALLAASMMQIDAHTQSLPVRSTANQVVAVVEGEGESQIGDQVIQWSKRDVLTIPQHQWARHRAFSEDARLFVVSDADAMQRLNLLREDIDTTVSPKEEQ
jgi:gentisate 1,2-dioxygenase